MTSSIAKNPYSSIPYSQHHKQQQESFSTIDNKSQLYQTYDKAILTNLKSRLLGIPKQLNLYSRISSDATIQLVSNDLLPLYLLVDDDNRIVVPGTGASGVTITTTDLEKAANCGKLEVGVTYYIHTPVNGPIDIEIPSNLQKPGFPTSVTTLAAGVIVGTFTLTSLEPIEGELVLAVSA
jgi:hypothetical protein